MAEFKTSDFKILAPFHLVEKDANVLGEETSLTIAGYCNYCGTDASGKTYVDLTGDVVEPMGMDVSVWADNPVILMNHERDSVIGKGINIEKRPDGIYLECTIFKDAMDAKDWYRIKSGLINRFSVGFRTQAACYKEIDDQDVFFITKSLLLEVSCVSIPACSPASFNIIKALPDGSFTSNSEEKYKEDEPQQDKEETAMTNIKVKRADLLSADQLDAFKSLGGDVEAEVEVTLSAFVKGLVEREVAELLAAKEKEAQEAAVAAAEVEAVKAAEVAEVAAAEAEAAKAVEDAAKLEEEKALADELGEYKALIETLKAAIAEEK